MLSPLFSVPHLFCVSPTCHFQYALDFEGLAITGGKVKRIMCLLSIKMKFVEPFSLSSLMYKVTDKIKIDGQMTMKEMWEARDIEGGAQTHKMKKVIFRSKKKTLPTEGQKLSRGFC